MNLMNGWHVKDGQGRTTVPRGKGRKDVSFQRVSYQGEEAPQAHGAPLALHAAETKSMGMTRPPKPPEDGGGQRTCPSRQTPPGGQTPGPAAQDHPPPASVQPAS